MSCLMGEEQEGGEKRERERELLRPCAEGSWLSAWLGMSCPGLDWSGRGSARGAAFKPDDNFWQLFRCKWTASGLCHDPSLPYPFPLPSPTRALSLSLFLVLHLQFLRLSLLLASAHMHLNVLGVLKYYYIQAMAKSICCACLKYPVAVVIGSSYICKQVSSLYISLTS